MRVPILCLSFVLHFPLGVSPLEKSQRSSACDVKRLLRTYIQVRIVKHAFEIIHLLTDQNPNQVIVDAIINRYETAD